MKKLGNMKYSWFLILAIIAITGIIIGSFFDFQISSAIVDVNAFESKMGESFAEVFGYMLAPISSTLIFLALWKNKSKFLKVLGVIILIGFTGAAVYLYGKAFNRSEYALGAPNFLCFPISFALMAGASIITFILCKTKDKDLLFKVGLAIALVLAIELIIQTGIKYIADRPRYREIVKLSATNELYQYKNWWEFSWLKNGIPDDTRRSFPSGHTMTSIATISLVSLSLLFENKKHLNLVLFIFGLAYGLFTAFLRMRAGAHFLSDVSFGMLISTILIFIIFKIVFRKVK